MKGLIFKRDLGLISGIYDSKRRWIHITVFDIFHLQPEASEIKVREHSTPQEDDHEPVWSFLVLVIADESLQSVQLFFQKKQLLNAASRTQNLIVASDRAHPFQGSFFKSTARKLNLDSMKEDTIMVMTSLRALM